MLSQIIWVLGNKNFLHSSFSWDDYLAVPVQVQMILMSRPVLYDDDDESYSTVMTLLTHFRT